MLSLLVIDLDGLKRINDLGGHQAGDVALRAAADALRSAIRVSDTPCRLGGDEFAVILPGATPDQAVIVAERAQERLAEAGRGQYSFSGGVAMTAEESMTAYELYRSADIAAYRAKSAGGARTLLAKTAETWAVTRDGHVRHRGLTPVSHAYRAARTPSARPGAR